MLKNYLKSALRNIIRYRFISFVNIFGLTVGITCCLLILTYIISETSYDKYNKNADRTYRVTRTFYNNGIETPHLGSVAPPFGPLLKNAFPCVEKVTRVYPSGDVVLHYKEKNFTEKNAFFADANFLDVFTLDVIKGSRTSALTEPYSVIITESIAKKYFGNNDPINQTISFDNTKHQFKVTGVFQPFPLNSHMHPNMLMSFSTLRDTAIYGEKQLETNYGNNSFFTYLLFPKDYNVDLVKSQLSTFLDRDVHMPGAPIAYKTSKGTSLTLQKLTDIHLKSHLDSELEENGDITRVYIFSVIALFILLIACINYMNLSTARSVVRAKEIGIRKVIGARRGEIIKQFLTESVLIVMVGFLLALFITKLVLPGINTLTALNLSFHSLLQLKVILVILLLPLIIGIISGIYPAIIMSSFKPVKVLKGIFKVNAGGISFRKVLVVTQFSISIILIVATIIVFQQLHYMQQKSLGFNKDQVVDLNYNHALNSEYDLFRNELLKNPAVKEVSRSTRIPSGRLLDDENASVEQPTGMQPAKVDIKCVGGDYGFIPTYNIKMAAGRNFSKVYGTDTTNFILNQVAVKQLGWKTPQDAIGKRMVYGNRTGQIIGVINDFHFESLHQKIIPLVLYLQASKNNNYSHLSVKISGSVTSAISSIGSTWHRYLPETPFDYTFLDSKFQQLYSSEQQQGSLFTIFSFVAIFIACLGLFGLSAFTISLRVKEIGVRKVLGASLAQIVIELSKDFMKLVFIAILISSPFACWGMNKWLQGFAYRIDIRLWVPAMAGVTALFIAFLTISLQSIRAAITNPVESLRSE